MSRMRSEQEPNQSGTALKVVKKWGGAKMYKLLFLACLSTLGAFNTPAVFSQVGIGTATPNASSILDLTSTTKGMLISRVTLAERNAIASPANSLLVFNTTDQCLQIYLNSQWQNIYCDVNCSVPPPTPGAITGNITPCQNATGETYSIVGVPGATSYNWSVPSGATITAGQGTTGIVVSFGTTNGNISVTSSNNCGTSAAQTLAITLATVPVGVTASVSPNPICPGATLTLTGAATGATGWSWIGPNAFSSSSQVPTIAGITPAAAGVYTLTANNSCGSAAPVNTASVVVNTAPAAPTADTHTPSSTQIVWNWNTVTGATGYKYNTANNYGTATDNGPSVTYTKSGLTCNTAYTLYVWAYDACGNSTVTTLTQTTAACFTCGSTVNDVDGNTYNTVLIGTQCWLKENMRTTKYPGGGAITKGNPAEIVGPWSTDVGLYSCPPIDNTTGEDCAAAASLGMLYQWSAAMDGSTTAGAQGICPTGWHVPSDIDWKTLEGSLGMSVAEQNLTGQRGTTEGSEMADHVADQNWNAGILVSGSGFGNAAGLRIGATGYRTGSGNYVSRAYETYLWTSTNENAGSAWGRYLDRGVAKVFRNPVSKQRGASVRCVKD